MPAHAFDPGVGRIAGGNFGFEPAIGQQCMARLGRKTAGVCLTEGCREEGKEEQPKHRPPRFCHQPQPANSCQPAHGIAEEEAEWTRRGGKKRGHKAVRYSPRKGMRSYRRRAQSSAAEQVASCKGEETHPAHPARGKRPTSTSAASLSSSGLSQHTHTHTHTRTHDPHAHTRMHTHREKRNKQTHSA